MVKSNEVPFKENSETSKFLVTQSLSKLLVEGYISCFGLEYFSKTKGNPPGERFDFAKQEQDKSWNFPYLVNCNRHRPDDMSISNNFASAYFLTKQKDFNGEKRSTGKVLYKQKKREFAMKNRKRKFCQRQNKSKGAWHFGGREEKENGNF